MTDPGLADRIRHAARLSPDSPRVRVTGFDALTVERNRWRRGHVACSLRRAWWFWRRPTLGHLWMTVWWTREGLRCR